MQGPAGYYSGSVPIGPAQSIEFVVGGIMAGDGYTITLTGVDQDNDPCTGTSNPFTVQPGMTTSTDVLIHCAAGDAAQATEVTTGNVAVEVGVQTM